MPAEPGSGRNPRGSCRQGCSPGGGGRLLGPRMRPLLSGHQPSVNGLSACPGLCSSAALLPSPSGYSGDLWVLSARRTLSRRLFQGILQEHGAHSGLGKGLATVNWHGGLMLGRAQARVGPVCEILGFQSLRDHGLVPTIRAPNPAALRVWDPGKGVPWWGGRRGGLVSLFKPLV